MIDPRTKLTVIHDNTGVFTEYSRQAVDFSRDTFTFGLTPSTDYLYIGFDKPFHALYFELDTPLTTSAGLTMQYWDGSSWTALTFHDDTNEFRRSGFMRWDRPSDWASTTVNSVVKYYVRFNSANQGSVIYRGINLVFSDDHQMKQEFFEIDNANLLPSGESSHIMTHVACRNHIIQKLRNQGYIKTNATTGLENIDQWDLLDIFEIRQAATFLALSKIFFNLSDSVDDNWWQKYKEYQDKFEEAMRLAALSIDMDDDGQMDSDERRTPNRAVRWNR